jgi:hypothetical protein
MHTYALVQLSYITTRFNGANHDLQGRQHLRPKNTEVRRCLSCNAQIAIFRACLQNRAVYVTHYTWEVRPSTQSCLCHTWRSMTQTALCWRGKRNTTTCAWQNGHNLIAVFFGLWCCLPWWWCLAPPKHVGIWRDCISMRIFLVQRAGHNLIDAR